MKHLAILFALFLFPACAAMQQQYVDTVCNTEGSFQQGYNDAASARPMDSSFASMCAVDQDQIRRAYREGFDKGLAQKAKEPKPVEIHVVHEPSPLPPGDGGPAWECKEAFGEKDCGYDCKEAYGKVKCAKRRSHNCVEAYGTIKCGLRCREEYGEIVCERYE